MWKRIASAFAVIVATILALAWLLGWFGEDPALAEVKAMQEQLASPTITEADRRAVMDQLRGKIESLSESSRKVAWENGRETFERREMSNMGRILAMKPQERTKALDDEINRTERRRAEWQQRSNNAQANRPRGGQPSGGRANRSDEQRISRLKNRLDRSTPEQRATRAEFTKLVNQRRAQRGLPPMQRGRG